MEKIISFSLTEKKIFQMFPKTALSWNPAVFCDPLCCCYPVILLQRVSSLTVFGKYGALFSAVGDNVNAKALNISLKDAIFLKNIFYLGAAAALHCLILSQQRKSEW